MIVLQLGLAICFLLHEILSIHPAEVYGSIQLAAMQYGGGVFRLKTIGSAASMSRAKSAHASFVVVHKTLKTREEFPILKNQQNRLNVYFSQSRSISRFMR